MKRYQVLRVYFLAIFTKTYLASAKKNLLRNVQLHFLSKFRDFFSCCPVKYTGLPMQHFRTQKKRFPFLKFGAKAIEYTVRPSAVTRLHSFCNEYHYNTSSAIELITFPHSTSNYMSTM